MPAGKGCAGWASTLDRRRSADVQLLVDTWWLIVSFDYIAFISTDLGWGGLLSVFAFVAYRLVVVLGLALWRVSAIPNERCGSLLLRVFGFQRRTEQLFDVIAQRWRLRGAVAMIAGSDLA